jgi:hypothetical protein
MALRSRAAGGDVCGAENGRQRWRRHLHGHEVATRAQTGWGRERKLGAEVVALTDGIVHFRLRRELASLEQRWRWPWPAALRWLGGQLAGPWDGAPTSGGVRSSRSGREPREVEGGRGTG